MDMSSGFLIEVHGDFIRQLRSEGLGRHRIANRLSEKIGQDVAPYFVQSALKRMKLDGKKSSAIEIHEKDPPQLSSTEMPIEQWIEGRVKASQRKIGRASRSKRHLVLPAEPIGIGILGDPHVDNEGCDWAQLYDHVNTIKATEGALAACVGDVQDNWIGRLARIYSESSTTASDGWRASEWLLNELQWIAIVGGNHDKWAHGPGVDPLGWLSRQCGVKCYDTDELRIHLSWQGRPELEPIIWVLRHDFPGRSWYHPTHGLHKEGMLDGQCHLLTAGHIHQWGLLETEQRHGRVTRAVRVRGYKRADSFAKSKGYYEQQYGAACFVVIDPESSPPSRIRIFWDIEDGCRYLEYLRSQRGGD